MASHQEMPELWISLETKRAFLHQILQGINHWSPDIHYQEYFEECS